METRGYITIPPCEIWTMIDYAPGFSYSEVLLRISYNSIHDPSAASHPLKVIEAPPPFQGSASPDERYLESTEKVKAMISKDLLSPSHFRPGTGYHWLHEDPATRN